MSKMDQLNTTEATTVELTAEIPGSDYQDILDEIIADVERQESENCNNTTVTGHSLLFNHTRYDSKPMAEFGPEFPTLNVDAGFSDKTSVDNKNNLPETNQTTVDANFHKEICEKIIPITNDGAIQGNSVGQGAEFVATLHQLQRQNSELKDQVVQKDEIIFGLKKNILELLAHVKWQDEIIKELRKQPDIHRLNLQISTGERLKRQEMTEIDQEPAAELTERPQIEISQVHTAMTNEKSIIIDCSRRDQLQDIESGQSSTENGTETGSDSKEIKQSEHARPSLQEHNFNRSDHPIQDRSARIRGSGGKRIKFNVENIEESHTNARNSRNQSKSHTCGECKKQFNSRRKFNKHFKIHEGKKPYMCNDCDDGFNQESQLKKHQKKHKGFFPYKCEKCEDVFACPSTLKSHLGIHSDEKPFICYICLESFRLQRELSQHMYTHSGETFHKCNECQNVFRSIPSLNKHILHKHQ